MAATGSTPIILYNSGTTTKAPVVANMSVGELAINYTDGIIFYYNGTVIKQFTPPTLAATGGTIDGVVIGGTTPSTAKFTSMITVAGTIDGTTIGATTPTTGRFTTPTTGDSSLNAATTAFVGTAITNANANLTGKNVLINGDFSISQVNGTTAITPTSTVYALDQWQFNLSQSSKITSQQVSTSLNSIGSPLAIKFTTVTAYASAAGDVFNLSQPIEGYNLDRFLYGSTNAKVSSLQFKANASIAGTYSGSISNYAGTRSYVFTFVLAANTDTLIQIPNISGDTAGTWIGASTAGAAQLRFDLGSGTNFRTTAGSWQTGNFIGATGASSLVATSSATLAISEVQFELGPICTAYERKLISQSLSECQRYLQYYTYPNNTFFSVMQATTNTSGYGAYQLSSFMRSTPTTTLQGTLQMNNAGGSSAGGLIGITAISNISIDLTCTNASGLVSGNASLVETYSVVNITFSAQL